jgi:hypothetical protein
VTMCAIYSVLWVLLGRFTACSAAGGGERGKGQGETRGKRRERGQTAKCTREKDGSV